MPPTRVVRRQDDGDSRKAGDPREGAVDEHSQEQLLEGHRDWYCPRCHGEIRAAETSRHRYRVWIEMNDGLEFDPVEVDAPNVDAAITGALSEVLEDFDLLTRKEREMIAAADRLRRRMFGE
jgi:hypothetical protein